MSQKVRHHLRSNLIAYLALLVSLSGNAYAVATIGSADIKRDAVLSRHIKDGQVRSLDVANDSTDFGLTGTDIEDGSLTGAEVGDGSLSGPDIENGSVTGGDVGDDSLGGIDIAAGSLDGSDIAFGSLTGADIDGSEASIPCPAGMAPAGRDLCYDMSNRTNPNFGSLDFNEATVLCADAGLRLPTLAEAFQAVELWQPTSGARYWTSIINDNAPYVPHVWVYFYPASYEIRDAANVGIARCVTTRLP